MDVIAGVVHGLAALSSPLLLAACGLGLLVGIIAGFLPGLSPAGGLALVGFVLGWLIEGFGLQSPVVFTVAVAYGTLYGRALAAINFEAAANDAFGIARSDWPALIATLLVAVAAAVALAPAVAAMRSSLLIFFGPAEISAFVAFVLLGGAAFGRGSAAAALAMIVLGLLLGLVGADIETGTPRLTLGLKALENGFDIIEVGLGLFVVANAIDDLVRSASRGETDTASSNPAIRGPWPDAVLAVLAGFLPTNGATFAATVGAQRSRPTADRFDPASQRGAAAIIRAAMLSDIRLSASLIVLFIWLAPVDVVTVLLRDTVRAQGMLTKGITDLTPIAALAGATLVLAHIVPLIVIAVLARARWRPIRIDVRVVAPLLIIAACVAAWMWDDSDPAAVVIMLAFGLIGYGMIRAGFDRSLMFFAFAVAETFEENIRRTMLIARGDLTVYMQRPICAVFLIAGVLIFVIARAWRRYGGKARSYAPT